MIVAAVKVGAVKDAAVPQGPAPTGPDRRGKGVRAVEAQARPRSLDSARLEALCR